MQVNLPVNSWPLARRGENARLVVLVVPAVLAALTLSPAWDSQPVLSLANWIAIVMFAMAAFLLADEDGQRGTGKLFLAAAGCLVLLTLGDNFRVGPIPAVAYVIGPLVFPILAVVSLRYPDPRLTNRAHRTFVAVEVAHLVVLRTLIGLTSTRESLALPSGAWWPQVVNSPPLNAILRALLDGGGIALTVIFVLLLRRRLRGSFALDRRDLLPVGLNGHADGVSAGLRGGGRAATRRTVIGGGSGHSAVRAGHRGRRAARTAARLVRSRSGHLLLGS